MNVRFPRRIGRNKTIAISMTMEKTDHFGGVCGGITPFL
jgi:hypothetical protein